MIEPGAIKTEWGLIAAQHLTESSEGTAYEKAGTQWAKNIRWAYSSRWLSSPSVISRAICRAVNSRRPKARYCKGRFSFLGRCLHAILPSRWWDAMMRQGGRIAVKWLTHREWTTGIYELRNKHLDQQRIHLHHEHIPIYCGKNINMPGNQHWTSSRNYPRPCQRQHPV